jgi:hypothetical protein
MHLHDLLGDGEAQTDASLGLGVLAVNLVELLEDASLVLFGNAGPCIDQADVEVAVDCPLGVGPPARSAARCFALERWVRPSSC